MIFVLYHAHCPDGFGAAFAAWMKFRDDATYLPAEYDKPVPEPVLEALARNEALDIYIVDFIYPRETLEGLARHPLTRRVIVLDHHRTAARLLQGLREPPGMDDLDSTGSLYARFDMEKSGAVLAWEYFHPGRRNRSGKVPEMLLYLQDRDLWQWKLPESRAINAALWNGGERDFEYWRASLEHWKSDFALQVIRGTTILRAQAMMLDALVAGHEHIQGPNGELALRVNSPVLQSELAERLLKDNQLAEFACVWCVRKGKRHVSLRSRPGGCDVSQIAEFYGGGGHPCAAGYITEP